MNSSSIYLDYNATTPLAPEVVAGITQSLSEDWGNPSSSYKQGVTAKNCIETSRTQVARMLNANPDDIIFTSGGTEANNMVIKSVAKFYKRQGFVQKYGLPHMITSNVEHDSIMKVLQEMSIGHKNGDQLAPEIELSIVPVNTDSGCLVVDDVLKEIRPSTCLITIMHANNESGVIMPISEIAEALEAENRERAAVERPKIFFHTDAAQTLGKIRVDIQKLNVDYLTVVGHKFYGPRIGALFVKNLIQGETPAYSLLDGGGQERGYRSGTENTPMIVGLGIAAHLVAENIDAHEANMLKCRKHFEISFLNTIPGSLVNFISNKNRLPNTISACVPEPFTGRAVLQSCAGQIDASLGAACHSHTVDKPSQILIASGVAEDAARRTIRFSVGRSTSITDIDKAVQILASNLNQ